MKLDIVGYHYVRRVNEFVQPRLKALDVGLFEKQLAYFDSEFQVVSTAEVLEALCSGRPLPEQAVWLTFDDGYRDHFDNVMPLLDKYGMKAAFFPVASAVLEGDLLDVNALHYILSYCDDIGHLNEELEKQVKEREWGESGYQYFRATVDVKSRYDDPEVMFFKRMLQRELPEVTRKEIIRAIFRQVVTAQPAEVSSQLYMSYDELLKLHQMGHTVGSHTYSHRWLSHLTFEEQQAELTRSLQFIRSIIGPTSSWTMSYPNGGYNSDTLEILSGLKCSLAVTTNVATASVSPSTALTLSRWDATDIAKKLPPD